MIFGPGHSPVNISQGYSGKYHCNGCQRNFNNPQIRLDIPRCPYCKSLNWGPKKVYYEAIKKNQEEEKAARLEYQKAVMAPKKKKKKS